MNGDETRSEPQPQVLGGVVPYLSVSNAHAAAEFYKEALAAEEVARHEAQDGRRLLHCHLYINGGSIMLNDAFPDQGMPLVAPQGFTLTLMVDDIDAWFKRAVDAGCEVITPVATMFWGDRFAALKDRFGVSWAMNEGAA